MHVLVGLRFSLKIPNLQCGGNTIQIAETIEHRIHAKVLDFFVERGHHEVLKDDSETRIKIGAKQTPPHQADCSGLMVMGVKHCLKIHEKRKERVFLSMGSQG